MKESFQKYNSDHVDLGKMVLNCMIKYSVSAWQITYLSSLLPDHSLGSIVQYSKLFNMLSQASAIPMLLKPSSLHDAAQAPLFMKPSLIPLPRQRQMAPSAAFSQPLGQTSHMQHGIVPIVYFHFSHTRVRIL